MNLFSAQYTSREAIMQHVPYSLSGSHCSLCTMEFSEHELVLEFCIEDDALKWISELVLRVGNLVNECAKAYNFGLRDSTSRAVDSCASGHKLVIFFGS